MADPPSDADDTKRDPMNQGSLESTQMERKKPTVQEKQAWVRQLMIDSYYARRHLTVEQIRILVGERFGETLGTSPLNKAISDTRDEITELKREEYAKENGGAELPDILRKQAKVRTPITSLPKAPPSPSPPVFDRVTQLDIDEVFLFARRMLVSRIRAVEVDAEGAVKIVKVP